MKSCIRNGRTQSPASWKSSIPHLLIIPMVMPQRKIANQIKGVASGDPGVHVTPLCKPFCKQTTYNIQVTIWWVPSVWLSVTPLWKILATPMGTTEHIFTLWSISELCNDGREKSTLTLYSWKSIGQCSQRKLLRQYRIPAKVTNITSQFYDNVSAFACRALVWASL